jgi:hypothetical protein
LAADLVAVEQQRIRASELRSMLQQMSDALSELPQAA